MVVEQTFLVQDVAVPPSATVTWKLAEVDTVSQSSDSSFHRDSVPRPLTSAHLVPARLGVRSGQVTSV